MRRCVRRLGACIPAALIGLALASPAAAQPPLWKVSDADSTMYLFGTVHVLKPETQWLSPALELALTGSDEVWFEIDPMRMDDPVLMGRMIPLMMDMQRPLSSKLDSALYQRFSDVAVELGANPAQLEPFKPAPAAVMLAGLALARAGYSPDSGVDKALRAMIAERPVREFETPEQQIRFIADLPDDVQVALLDAALDDMADLGHLDKVVENWAGGDTAAMTDIFLADLMNEHAGAYDIFVKDRNVAWVDALEAELAGAGSDFIAVGALHLVGPDGLPKLLTDRGFTVERVN